MGEDPATPPQATCSPHGLCLGGRPLAWLRRAIGQASAVCPVPPVEEVAVHSPVRGRGSRPTGVPHAAPAILLHRHLGLQPNVAVLLPSGPGPGHWEGRRQNSFQWNTSTEGEKEGVRRSPNGK